MLPDRNPKQTRNVPTNVTWNGIIDVMRRVAQRRTARGRGVALWSVVLVGCARQAPEPPEPSGAPEVATTQRDDTEWTEADEVSGEEMPPPVIVAEGERHTETAVVEVEPPEEPGPDTEVIDLTADPVAAPADTVHTAGERTPSGSLLTPDVLAGPKK